MCRTWDCGGLGDAPHCVVRGTMVVRRCPPVCRTWDYGRLGDALQCVVRGTVVG